MKASSEPKFKLFVDAHAFDKEHQGTQTFIKELYTCFLSDYPETDVYFGTSKPERLRLAFPNLNPSNILSYKSSSKGFLRFYNDIPAYIKKYQFDFAHFQYISPRPIRGCKYIVTLHDITYVDFPKEFSWLYRKSREYIFGRSIRKAHIKTTVSAYSQSRIAERYDLPHKNVHIIPNGINSGSSAGIDKELAVAHIKEKFNISDFILCVSRVEKRKNHELLLRQYLALGLDKRNISLVFIGKKSAEVPVLIQLINKLSAEQKRLFFWLEDIAEPDLVAFYNACRLFVYPSKAEGFGIPPLEAASCGAPVLCSSATAMSQYDFFKPYVFDPANEREFKEKMFLMIDNPPTAIFLNQVAAHVAKSYQWKESSKIFYNLLVQ